MNDDQKNTTAGPDDELVAFLDGELDSEALQQVEQRLQADTEYRLRLSQLQRSFDLLDSLPRAEVEETFTRSTMEMVVLSESQSMQSVARSQRARKILGWLWATACLVCISFASYLFVTGLVDRPNKQLVKDLPLIEHLDLYRYADSMDFLRQLDSQGLFAEEQVDDLQ